MIKTIFQNKIFRIVIIAVISVVILSSVIKRSTRTAVNNTVETVEKKVTDTSLEDAGESAADFINELNKKRDIFMKGFNKNKQDSIK